MTPRILRTLGVLGAVPLLLAMSMTMPLSAHAADDGGRIDHVETADGEVNVLFSVPGLPSGVSADPDTLTVTMDGSAVEAEATPVQESGQSVRRTALLAIDVSISMRGTKFAGAKQAALAYIDNAPGDVYVGLVTFASDVATVQEPTQDREALTSAVDSLQLTPATHLYDGVLQSLDVAGGDGQRSVLLLSDGKDTTTTGLDTVLREAENSGVRVDVVSLDQRLAPNSPLNQISAVTAGTVTSTSDLDMLEALFTEEANDLATQLVVTFPAPEGKAEEGTLAVSVEADGTPYADNAFVTLDPVTATSAATPTYEAPATGINLSKNALLLGIGLFFAGLAVLLVFGMTRMMPAPATPMQQQLSLYTVHGMKRSDKTAKGDQGTQLRESAVALAEGLINQRDFEERLAHKLDRAGLHLKPAEWLLLHAGIAILSAFAGFLLTGNFLMAMVFFALGAFLPWFYLSFKEKRRIKAFNGQLAQTLQIIAGALQAGLSLPQAVDTVVQEATDPIASEFQRAIIEQRLGVEIEDTLDTVAERMGSIDFKWVVMAIRIQREVGGNLSELLLTVAATLREREYLRRQVSVLSAEGRLSAFILGGLPPAFMAYLAIARPTYVAPLFHTTIGYIMLAIATVMMTIGTFWLSKAVKVEV